MSQPEWLKQLDQAYQGEANGAVKAELQRKWGEGKRGPELLTVLVPRIEEVFTGLQSFGEPSLEALKGALNDALKASSTGASLASSVPQPVTADSSGRDCEEMLGRLPTDFIKMGKDLWAFCREGRVLVRPIFFSELQSKIAGVDSVIAPSPGDSLLASDLTTYARNDAAYPSQSVEVVGQDHTGLVMKPWILLARHSPGNRRPVLLWNRNSKVKKDHADTTMPEESCRPDGTISCWALLTLDAEEKRGGKGNLKLAKEDVEDKAAGGFPSICGYWDVPYIFAYAASGTEVERGAINVENGQVDWEGVVFDLTSPLDRLELIRGSLNQYRLLPLFRDKSAPPEMRLDIHSVIETSNDTTIHYVRGEDDVGQKSVWRACKTMKKFDLYLTKIGHSFEGIKEAYAATSGLSECVQALMPPTVTHGRWRMLSQQRRMADPAARPRRGHSTYEVYLSPLGWSKPLSRLSKEGLRLLIRAWLVTCEKLHAAGLVHTDVRAANSLWTNDGPFVIDLETARPFPFLPRIQFSGWEENVVDGETPYTDRTDVHYIGKIMEAWSSYPGNILEEEYESLKQLLMRGPSAANGLTHSLMRFDRMYVTENLQHSLALHWRLCAA